MIFEIPQEDILKMLLRQINTFFLYLKRKDMNRRIIIGANVMVGANTIIKDEVVPSNVIVFGESPNLIIKKKKNLEPFYW